MIRLEKLLEASVRAAIRASINIATSEVPSLQDARIIGFWNDSESGTWEGNDATGLRVMLTAHPSSADGYQPGIGLMPLRSVVIDVACVSQPDNDKDRVILCALYNAVRSTFEASTLSFTMPAGVSFGGILITNGGAGSFEGMGQAVTFSVDFRLAIT